MLSQPFQNSDMFHRTETLSDMRAAQSQRDAGAANYAELALRRKEEIRESEVEGLEKISLDPDQQKEHPLPKRERKRQKSKSSDEGADHAPTRVQPPHLPNLGAGHIDITA